ncbi:MAG: hypothetical protein JNL83_19265 [Myxococcales bacterium]|nr:hypothetical protein [Myxococcales bacterium]
MTRWLLVLAVLASLTAPAAAEREDSLYTCKALPANAMIAVSIKPDASLLDLATWITGFTCKNVVYDGGVAKHATKLTLITPQKMTAKQALALFVDAVEATGLVVKVKPDTIVISLGPNMPRTCPDVVAATTPPAPVAETAVPPSADPGLSDAELDAGIKSLGKNQVSLKRELLDRMLANPMAIAKGARVIPATKNGVAVGFKLYAVRPKSVWARLGFANGDTINRVNGMDVSSPDKALEVYTRLREAKALTIDIERRGKPLALGVTFVD